MVPDAIDFTAVRRVLVTKLRHHGDVLLTSPVFSALKAHAPQVEVDALVYRETLPMLANHPAISQLFTVDREWKRQGALAQLRSESRLLGSLRNRQYDLLVHLTEHPRGAWLRRMLGIRYGVAPARRDPPRLWRTSFTHFYALPRSTRRHTVELNLDALRRLGLHPEDAAKRLVLVPGTEADARADALLRTHGLTRGGFIQLHPGSRWLFKCWPAAQVAQLIDRLIGKGTGNMELQLERKLSNRRIYPAIDIVASSTRRDDLLLDKDTFQRMWILRKHMADMNPEEALNTLLKNMKGTKDNAEFLISMNG